jgi:hypothetical protein
VKPHPHTRPFRCTRAVGFVLIEVMTAVLIVSTVVGTLASAAHEALIGTARTRDKAATASAENLESAGTVAWAWGPQLQGATWGAGPVLRVRGGVGAAEDSKVGVWVAGWALGEWELTGAAQLDLGPELWSGLAHEELVIRARVKGGEWGPPWRSVVPDVYGNTGAQATGVAKNSTNGLGYETAGTVAHMRSYCLPLLTACWADLPVLRSLQGVAFELTPHGSGICLLESYGRLQCWLGSSGRRFDVYF